MFRRFKLCLPIWLKGKGLIPQLNRPSQGLRLPLLERYLWAELTPFFLFSVGLLSSLGVAVGTFSDLGRYVFDEGVPMAIALQVLGLKLPEFAAYALPFGMLLTTLMTYGRLSRDSELIALRSCGISVYRLALPGLLFGLIVTGLSYGFNDQILPPANYQARMLLEQARPAEKIETPAPIIFPEFTSATGPNHAQQRRLSSLLYAQQHQGDRLLNVTIMRWQQTQLTEVILAQSAQWQPQQQYWQLYQGLTYVIATDASYQGTRPFQRKICHLSRGPLDLAQQRREPEEMTLAQAQQYAQLLKLSQNTKRLRHFQVRIQQKLAFPFICLIFGTMGSALGMGQHQGSRFTSFGLSVGIVFAYYLLGFVIGSLGISGTLSPLVAAWLPNFFGLSVGGWLLYRAAI